MSYSIVPTPTFERSLKVLAKRYKSMKDDLKNFRQSLQENPLQGSDLGGGLRKVRMAIASKGKGKSGGARVITYNVLTKEQDGTIYLLEIYDKSDASTVDVKIIQKHGVQSSTLHFEGGLTYNKKKEDTESDDLSNDEELE